QRGHRVIFLAEEAFKGRLASRGFEEHNYKFKLNMTQENGQMKPGEMMARDLLTNKVIGEATLDEKMKQAINYIFYSETAKAKLVQRNAAIKEAIQIYSPHLIIVDKAYLEPAVYYSNIPWIWN